LGSALFAFDAEMGRNETALGNGLGIPVETAKPKAIVCFACVQVKEIRGAGVRGGQVETMNVGHTVQNQNSLR